tara:strand:+ start:63 stop:401 length:339 start_codon:yes stop_codon:yes gene_type:complete
MKKAKLCVAALLLGGFSYGQSPSNSTNNDYRQNKLYEETNEHFKAVEFMVDDVIESIRMDMYYGHLERQRGEYYIKIIMSVKSKNRDIMHNVFTQRSKTLGEMQLMLDKQLK